MKSKCTTVVESACRTHPCFYDYSVAPFNAMKTRTLAETTENPGPGAYAAEKVKVVATVKDMMSNSFSTKVSSTRSSMTAYNFAPN